MIDAHPASSAMNPEITRRSFLQGLGASMVLAALPAIGISEFPIRAMPPIILKSAGDLYSGFTEKFFRECLEDIFRQVKAMSHLHPNRREREAIAKNIEEVLWEVRPMGLLIEMAIPYEKMITGEFAFHERSPMTIEVV